jgi:biotin carboxyl carrier protein
MKYDVVLDGVRHSIEFTHTAEAPSRLTVTCDGRRFQADAAELSPGAYSVLLNGLSIDTRIEKAPRGLLVRAAHRVFVMEILDPRSWQRRSSGRIELEGRQQVAAPMPGKVVRVLVCRGQRVEAGQGLLVVEAMKMQNEVCSPKSGTVEQLLAQQGQAVNAGEVLAVIA